VDSSTAPLSDQVRGQGSLASGSSTDARNRSWWSISARLSKLVIRSVRRRSSPIVWGPRSKSTATSAHCDVRERQCFVEYVTIANSCTAVGREDETDQALFLQIVEGRQCECSS
jgi:hypothetical protein